MGDLLDLIFNFFNFLDVFPAIEKHYKRFRDKDLHIVNRLLSLFIICFTVLFFFRSFVFYNLFGISTIKKLKFEIFHLDNGEITSSNILGDYSFV